VSFGDEEPSEEVAMLRLLVSVASVLFFVGASVPGDEKAKTVTLAEAVKEFNQRAGSDETGKAQPPLTEDEVVAAIRGWIREQLPAPDDVYGVYQTIAGTKKLPEGAKLTFTTKWSGFNKHEFDVWWVDLHITLGLGTGYGFRIRDQKLRCRPLGQ
jgi:hypothetical protein